MSTSLFTEYSNAAVELIEVKDAEYLGNFAIRISFNDGFSRVIDFKQFLLSSLHPSIRQYLDENKFKQFEIVDGDLNWNDYELSFSIEDLYEGKI